MNKWVIAEGTSQLIHRQAQTQIDNWSPEKLEGETMSPVTSTKPKDEPTIPVTILGQEHEFMVYAGTTYSYIGKNGSYLPLSSSSDNTIGFSGKTQEIPLTQPTPMHISGKAIVASLLYSANTPINLFWKRYTIMCSHWYTG